MEWLRLADVGWSFELDGDAWNGLPPGLARWLPGTYPKCGSVTRIEAETWQAGQEPEGRKTAAIARTADRRESEVEQPDELRQQCAMPRADISSSDSARRCGEADNPDHMIHLNGERFLSPYLDAMPATP